MPADEHRQLAEVLAWAQQLVGQAVVEAQADFAGVDQEHALRGFTAAEEFFAGQHGAADAGGRQDAELVGRQLRRQAAFLATAGSGGAQGAVEIG